MNTDYLTAPKLGGGKEAHEGLLHCSQDPRTAFVVLYYTKRPSMEVDFFLVLGPIRRESKEKTYIIKAMLTPVLWWVFQGQHMEKDTCNGRYH